MRGLPGLLIAAGLGVAGAVCNWLYLNSLAQNEARVAFIAVKPDVRLNVGDVFKSEHFEPVELPRSRLGNLEDVAPLWSARDAVIGLRANQPYAGGEIILRPQLTTPAQQDLAGALADDEIARWAPIDSRTVVSEQINPGDLVSFEVSRPPGEEAAAPPAAGGSPPANGEGEPALRTRPEADQASTTELIGPFRVLAIGGRRERPGVQQARGRVGGPEHTITIAVRMIEGRMEPRAVTLFDAVHRAGSRGVSVVLHSSRVK